MKNEYIEVVKRWRAGEVFSGEQLKANAVAASAGEYAARAADCAFRAYAYAAVEVASGILGADAVDAVDAAAYAADAADAADYWVKRYEELTGEK